jgi:hypothetical protein
MRLTSFQSLCTVAAISILVAGCSGGSTIAPKPAILNASARLLGRNDVFGQIAFDRLIHARGIRQFQSFDSCPATGPIKYVSDYYLGIVYFFVGKFSGQAPCGQIAFRFYGPTGLYVDRQTHDLYVGTGNLGGRNIVMVFHRGQLVPYNQYQNTNFEVIMGVTMAKDGTVITSNELGYSGDSISTWIGGPNGGTFVGNFQMAPGSQGGFITAQRDGTVYFEDLEFPNTTVLWSVRCPAGACGAQTRVAFLSFQRPGGLASDASGDVLAVSSDFSGNNSAALTLELPNPTPSSFPMSGSPFGMAINPLDHHMFVADIKGDFAAEYSYPSGALIGTVPAGTPGGGLIDIAIDP